MPTIVLSNMKTVIENTGRGYSVRVTSFGIGDGPDYPAQRLEVKTLADVRAAVKAYGACVAAALPGASFSVHIRFPRGERKMRGFDAAETTGDKLGTDDYVQTVDKASLVA